ncbi:MAG: hypothetical protein GF408_05825 [Candidatus Omnitrophica bacterium]|nr:hypothetical protein [Candidatus Omnitrophota bacterium]
MSSLALNAFEGKEFSPEEEIVSICARQKLTEQDKQNYRSIAASGNIDWDKVLGVSEENQVTPLVYRNLQVLKGFPDKIFMSLRESAARTMARNTLILSRMEKFSRKEDALFLKGFPFAVDVYEDPSLREFSDVDVLVRDMDAFGRVLSEEGFHPDDNEEDDGYRSQRTYADKDGLVIDAHVDAIGRRLHSEMTGLGEGMWEGARHLEYGGLKLKTPDLEHTLIFQAVHLAMHHGFSGLKWLVDINEFVRRYENEIDWERLLELCSKYKVKRPVYYTLLFTRDLFDTPVPEKVLDRFSRVRRPLDRWLFRKIKNSFGTDYLAELFMFDTIADTVKFVFLSFVKYPGHFLCFGRIAGKVVRAAVSK